MVVTVNGIEKELKFTFNSFRYMGDFDVNSLQDLEAKPFMIIGVAEELLIGALNSDPRSAVSKSDVAKFLEEFIESEDGDIVELFEELVKALEDSSFFKKLQKTKEPKKKVRK